jgi:8-amino-7-oxononanoate synthase
MPALEFVAEQRLKDLQEKAQYRVLQDTERLQGGLVERHGKTLLSFSCNDYLGLSQDNRVKEAAEAAIKRWGVGAGASRLVTGNHPLYAELEQLLASIKGTEAALVCGSGYLTNIGVIPALVDHHDLIIADKLVHACLLDGARLSQATLKRFKHNDVQHLKQLLIRYRHQYRHCLILTDHIFSMDGDIAPMEQLVELANDHDAWVLSDDAHGLGVCVEGQEAAKAHIQMGTLSKAVGAYGGYVGASNKVIEYLINTTRSFVFSTALPPAMLAASCEAIRIIQSEPEYVKTPLLRAQEFTKACGLPLAVSPIVPLILRDENKALHASKMLEEEGFLVAAIRPPTVPKGTARLRFTFSALHREEDVVRLASFCREKGWV